ncbi:HD domain-containing protein [Candidatus Pacearchaeota archaeon]|nr:HD domain-containing protein [Candidatus Pacearchaeota archaeon]
MEVEKLLTTIETLCAVNGKLEAIIEASPNIIFEIDDQGSLVYVNAGFCAFFKISPQRFRYYKIFDLFGSKAVNKAISDIFSGKKQFHNENLEIVVDGSASKFVELKLLGVPVNGKTYTVGIILDKTDILRALTNREYYIERLRQIINELKLDNRETIYNFAKLAEIHDHNAGKHLERMEQYALILGTEYYHAFKHRDKHLTEPYVEDLAIASFLHDIGKIGVSDTVLLKSGNLEEDEFDIMKQHTLIVGEALKDSKGKKSFLALGREIAYAHHERWDGTGYPRGLSGYAIPLSARLISVCDTYDTLITKRPKNKKLSHEEVVETILAERGKAFDPEVIDAFAKIHQQLKEIAEKYTD